MTVDSGATPNLFCYPSPSDEDLAALSALAYSVSEESCDKCRNYHIMWPYLRSVGANGGGPEYCWEELGRLLLETAQQRRENRWLLGGSADTGLMAMTHHVLVQTPGVKNSVTMVDRCQTPITLCRTYAGEVDLPVEILQDDILEFSRPQAFDIVLLHHLLGFFSEEGRANLLANTREWLAPGGRAFISTSYLPSKDCPSFKMEKRRAWREQVIRMAAASGKLELPEAEQTFLGRLANMTSWKTVADTRKWVLDDYVDLITSAGLEVIEIVDVPFSEQELEATGPQKPRCIFVARRDAG